MRINWMISLFLSTIATLPFTDFARDIASPTIPAARAYADPAPTPSAPIKFATLNGPITADTVYALDFDADVMVNAYPAGIVNVVKEAGPVKIRARFADGDGAVQTKTFKGKTVISLEPLATGTVTLVVVPVGAKTEAEWKTQSIDVDMGKGPTPAPSALKTDLKNAYAAETSATKADLVAKLSSLYKTSAADITADKYKSSTYFELFSDLSTVNAGQMKATDIAGIRKAIEKYLDAQLPTDRKTIVDKTTAVAAFTAVAQALDSLTAK